MNKYYYTMRCINYGDAALIAIGVHYEKDTYSSNMNCGVLRFAFQDGKLLLEPWAKQSGFENDGTKIIVD
jgi:hypothetical protein